MSLPLEGVLIVDFSQFLAGPYASLRLQDLGARVIKIENPDGGDLCRQIYLSPQMMEQESTLFHSINRGKESLTLDLKSQCGLADAKALITHADVVIQNFRPGVIQKLGLGYDVVSQIKPSVVYGSVSGFGTDGPWANLPGQDLLAQARSGLMWLSGNCDDGPVPVGLPLADILAGANLAHGLLAGLYKQATQGIGSLVETSLLESLVDAQFEFLTTYINSDHQMPQRLSDGSAHGYLEAPYGVYKTLDGQLALAMSSLSSLAVALESRELGQLAQTPRAGFSQRERIREIVAQKLMANTARAWEELLSVTGIWCARILDWPELMVSDTFKKLQMTSTMGQDDLAQTLMRSPLRVDGRRPEAVSLGPTLNQNGDDLRREFDL
ncbi:MAG: CoA transferase [Octadecabacter sp.]|nr:CoA transferase [Octadecabacter sp.]